VTPTPDFAEFIIGRAFPRPVGSIPLRTTLDAAGNGLSRSCWCSVIASALEAGCVKTLKFKLRVEIPFRFL
jgi:hypothetical protein